MTSPKQVVKSVGPKLVPFFKTLAIYFVVFPDFTKPSLLGITLKCLPVASLMFFVVMHGVGLDDEYTYSRRILIGLVFSCLGDGLLVFRDYFLHGMAAFGVAHVFYISALGFKPLKLKLGIALYALALLWGSLTIQHAEFPINVFAPFYAVLLATMIWRAAAHNDVWTWTKLCSCLGAILFGISDGLIGVHEFVSPLSHAQVLIMSTYYAAQFGIALSVVDSSRCVRDKEHHVRKQQQQQQQQQQRIDAGSMSRSGVVEDLRQRRPVS